VISDEKETGVTGIVLVLVLLIEISDCVITGKRKIREKAQRPTREVGNRAGRR
jgi:hypothetical protein